MDPRTRPGGDESGQTTQTSGQPPLPDEDEDQDDPDGVNPPGPRPSR